MKKILQTCLFLILIQATVISQNCNWNNSGCNHPPIVTFNPAGASVGEVGNYGPGANCHGFAKRYFEQGYSIVNAKSPTIHDPNVTNFLNDMASAPFIGAGPFSSHVQILGSSAADEAQADGVLYYTAGTITHSAIKIGKAFGNGAYGPQLYLSKWEPCGPVVQHTLYDIGYYSDPCIVNKQVKFFKFTGLGNGNGNTNCSTAPSPVISSNNICTSCSCAAYDGSFLVSAPSGWSNHQWSISAAGRIVWNLGSYIYIERNPNHSGWPNNNITVTLTATKNGCTKTYTTNPINLPSNCNGGGFGFSFSVNNENELAVIIDEEEVGKLKPKGNVQFSVYDLSGNSLGSTVSSEKEFTVTLIERFGQGPYVLRLTKEGKVYTRKVYFMKEED